MLQVYYKRLKQAELIGALWVLQADGYEVLLWRQDRLNKLLNRIRHKLINYI